MNLEFTEEQELLRATLREVLESQSSPDAVRALEDTPTGYSAELWRELANLDLAGLTVPEEFGGLGMSALDLVVVYSELGRALATTPHLTTSVLGAGLLLHAGTPEQQQDWLPKIARGEIVTTVAWYEPQRTETAAGVQLRAVAAGDSFRLSGTKIRVPLASSADAIYVLARTGDEPDAIDIFVIAPQMPGVELTQTLGLASEAEYELTLTDVELSADYRLGDAGTGWRAFEEALIDTWIAVAAYAVGGARRGLEMTVEYAKEREQFGKPIGSFQGLAHPIADIATEVTGAETLVHQAAWRRSQGLDVGPLAAMAKYYACDVFKRGTKVGQQVFGGVGFTRVIDMQLYFRRAKQLELTWVGPALLEEAVAVAELDGDRGWVSIDAGV